MKKKGASTISKNTRKKINNTTNNKGSWEAGAKNNPIQELHVMLELHWHTIGEALRKIAKAPFVSITNCLMISVAFTLPAVLYITMINLQMMVKNWQGISDITVYLTTNLKQSHLKNIHQSLLKIPDIKNIQFISAETGLKELQNWENLSEVLKTLESNPLPDLYKVEAKNKNKGDIDKIVKQVTKIPGIESVKTSQQWTQQLQSIIYLLHMSAIGLSILFSALILLSINNIVLQFIMNSQSEIQVIKLVGGTNGFVTLPFFYVGVIYGFFGALLATLIIWGQTNFFMEQVQNLISLYKSNFQPIKPGLDMMLSLIFSGMVIGGMGAFLGAYSTLKRCF